MDIELASGFTFKGILKSNCLLDDKLVLATVTDNKIGDVWAVYDNTIGSYRQYVWTGEDGRQCSENYEWVELYTEGLNMSTSDLLEYLYDIREYLDDHAKSVNYSTKQEAEQETRAILGTASDMVQFLIDKILKKEETDND